MPIDTLKIDRSFVRDSLTDANDAAIARAGIAEGVETEGPRDMPVSFGCVHHQGYLYSKPVPPESVVDCVRGKVAVQASCVS